MIANFKRQVHFMAKAELRAQGVEEELIAQANGTSLTDDPAVLGVRAAYNELYEQFTKGDQHDETTRRVSRKILSGVICGEVDKGGRLTLNLNLKEYAGISDSVQIVGNNNHIELWSPEEWAKETEIFESQSTDTLNINF